MYKLVQVLNSKFEFGKNSYLTLVRFNIKENRDNTYYEYNYEYSNLVGFY